MCVRVCVCVCVCTHGSELASDRDIGPFFCPSSEGIIIFCIFIYANTTWIISLSTFLSLSPKVSSLITAQQLAGNIFIINYLLFLWRRHSCITYSGGQSPGQLLRVSVANGAPMLMRDMFVLCLVVDVIRARVCVCVCERNRERIRSQTISK